MTTHRDWCLPTGWTNAAPTTTGRGPRSSARSAGLSISRPGRARKALEREVDSILKKNGPRWTKPLQAAGLGHSYQFRRGFLDGLTIGATLFVERGDELFRLAPTVRTVRFPNAANELTALAASRTSRGSRPPTSPGCVPAASAASTWNSATCSGQSTQPGCGT